jgi:hypothetical protein
MGLITFIIVWYVIGFYMVLLIAGIQSIPTDLFDAAKVDGDAEARNEHGGVLLRAARLGHCPCVARDSNGWKLSSLPAYHRITIHSQLLTCKNRKTGFITYIT